MNRIWKENFEEAQSLLSEEDRCAEILEEMCTEIDDGFRCTKRKHLAGDHLAHGKQGGILHRWIGYE